MLQSEFEICILTSCDPRTAVDSPLLIFNTCSTQAQFAVSVVRVFLWSLHGTPNGTSSSECFPSDKCPLLANSLWFFARHSCPLFWSVTVPFSLAGISPFRSFTGSVPGARNAQVFLVHANSVERELFAVTLADDCFLLSWLLGGGWTPWNLEVAAASDETVTSSSSSDRYSSSEWKPAGTSTKQNVIYNTNRTYSTDSNEHQYQGWALLLYVCGTIFYSLNPATYKNIPITLGSYLPTHLFTGHCGALAY